MATYIYGSNVIANMTSNSSVSQIASASSEYGTSYAAWKAFDGVSSTAQGWVSRGIAFPIFLQIRLQNKVIARKYGLFSARQVESPKDWTFEGSNDGVEWVVLDTQVNVISWINGGIKEFTINNNEAFQFYRINITSHNGDVNYVGVSEFSIYEGTILYDNKILLSSGHKNYRLEKTVSRENAVPVMTSALNANVEITSSAYNASDYPWYAFDGIVNATVRPFWFTNSTPPAGGHWLQVKFVKPKVITGISLASLLITGSSHSIKEFELYGSNDGVVYDKLYTNTQLNIGTKIYYDFESSKAYSYYRLNILSSYNLASTVGVNEMEIFQKKNQTMYVLETSDEIDFIKYGMKSDISLKEAVDNVKDVIKMNLSLASGKTFEHSIDMSKRRVDKIMLG
ncbi:MULTISPECIES: discoidin domain-containing protein [unclassified Paenibacillus]|uniref:discoidin domain-containing protein n=1 Tax=unclassified Paenibacillus TaxID=185978 RepID=UPI000CFCFA7E|nr:MULTISPECIES: discoidin domain-containing protein [unclassified Paenibacillus]PRA08990.1 hypothetical protein CQ043_03135 [Paenibacillus sp. MYb63]PRA48924.1 hypothetical protein CQ061_11590 [Paenibacillus sp. MYb67]QZN73218.1 discoidin domain-containing protein [Paenibacillus sp. DR312]